MFIREYPGGRYENVGYPRDTHEMTLLKAPGEVRVTLTCPKSRFVVASVFAYCAM